MDDKKPSTLQNLANRQSEASPSGVREAFQEGRTRSRDSVMLDVRFAEHRARYIQEGTDAEEGLKPEDAAHIDSILIEDKGEE